MSQRRPERVALVALLVTCLLTAAKLAVWAATESLAVLSQALDSGLDVVALALVFLAVRIASKPADETHHYGHAKAENLVAFTQTIVLAVIVVRVMWEAIDHLASGQPLPDAPWYALALLGGGAVVDLIRARYLRSAAKQARSEALHAGAVNITTDVGTSLVAMASLILVRGGSELADPIGALIVAVAVSVAAVRLGKRSVDVLMDRAPGAPVQAIARAASRASGVAETRRVRVRSAGSQLFADVTVGAGRTASLERAHDIAETVEREIERVVPGADVVVHVEPVSETSGLGERVTAAASRAVGVHEVHNVLIHAFNEGGREKLHVTLHAKVDRGISVAQAHDLSDRIEEAVRAEVGEDIRVDSHIEPLETTTFARDVTAERTEIIETVRAAALDEPDIVDCHEVLLTQSAAELSVVAHVRGRKDLPLSRIHDASVRIEKHVHTAHPEVGEVLIHFEPA